MFFGVDFCFDGFFEGQRRGFLRTHCALIKTVIGSFDVPTTAAIRDQSGASFGRPTVQREPHMTPIDFPFAALSVVGQQLPEHA
jgi:hypothetical protein